MPLPVGTVNRFRNKRKLPDNRVTLRPHGIRHATGMRGSQWLQGGPEMAATTLKRSLHVGRKTRSVFSSRYRHHCAHARHHMRNGQRLPSARRVSRNVVWSGSSHSNGVAKGTDGVGFGEG